MTCQTPFGCRHVFRMLWVFAWHMLFQCWLSLTLYRVYMSLYVLQDCSTNFSLFNGSTQAFKRSSMLRKDKLIWCQAICHNQLVHFRPNEAQTIAEPGLKPCWLMIGAGYTRQCIGGWDVVSIQELSYFLQSQCQSRQSCKSVRSRRPSMLKYFLQISW